MYVSLRIKKKIKQTLHGINTKISMTVPRNVSQACHEQSRPFPSPDDAESSGFTVDARQNHGTDVHVSISASCDIEQVDDRGDQLPQTLVGSIIETMLRCTEKYKPFAWEAVFKDMHPREVVPNVFRPKYDPLRLHQPDIVLARDVITDGSLNVDFNKLWYEVALDFKTGAVYTSIKNVSDCRKGRTVCMHTLCMI